MGGNKYLGSASSVANPGDKYNRNIISHESQVNRWDLRITQSYKRKNIIGLIKAYV